jgi:hypothetical protein
MPFDKVVWEREAHALGTKHVVRVHVQDGGRVAIEAYAIGRRGGMTIGYSGFSEEEWGQIVEAVSAQAELQAEVEAAERKAGWDPNP